MNVAVSVILYETPAGQLERFLSSLRIAVGEAKTARMLDQAQILLTEHSPHPVPQKVRRAWEEACASWAALSYCHEPANPGYGAGHNAAFRRSSGHTYFLAVNPDVELTPDALVEGLRFFSRHPTVGVLAPALVEQNHVRPSCFRHPDLWTLFLRALGVSAGTSRRIWRYECRDWVADVPVFNPPYMSGCCLFFRSSTFHELGGFDPRYFLYFEDFDLSARARRQGLSAYCPAMRVIHTGGGAFRKGWRHRWWFLRSASRFYMLS